MNPWRRFLRWLARLELREEREYLEACARALNRQLSRQPASGTVASLHDTLSEACRESMPLGCEWSVDQRAVEDLAPGQLRVVIERPAFPRSAA